MDTARERTRERMRRLRADPEYKRRERERDRARYAENVRRTKEHDKNDLRHDETGQLEQPRQYPDITDGETERRRRRAELARAKYSEDTPHREEQRRRSREAMQGRRCIPAQRVQEEERRTHQRGTWAATVSKFEKAIKEGPTQVCCCCGRLWFPCSMKTISKRELVEKDSAALVPLVFQVTPDGDEAEFCPTCLNSIREKKVPAFCLGNGLRLPTIPPELEALTRLEERLVSARHVFQSIWPVMGPNGQYRTKGGIINVPVCVDTTVNTLPRNVDDAQVIHLRLARKMTYVRDYMSGNVRPIRVYEAAKFLVTQPLYQQHNIVLSLNWDVQQAENYEAESADDYPNDYENEELPVNPGGGETLVTCDEGIRIAPAEGNRPVSILMEPDTEFLTFPKIFGGQKMSPMHMGKPLSSADFFKSLAMSYDRRAVRRNDFLLFMAKKLQLRRLTGNISTIMRKKSVDGRTITAADVRNSCFVEGLVQRDHGYRVLQGIRSSGEHWRKEKLKVMAMIRQFGLPTFFLTLTAAETQWPELLTFLKKINENENISSEEAMDLPYNVKAELIQSDPVTCARYYDKRFRECKKTWSCPNGPFLTDNALTHYYFRIEFQHRGSPHSHCLLWIKDAPKYDPSDPESERKVCEFVDSIISCSSVHDDPEIQNLIQYQKHRHTATCRKKKGRTCRFNIPFYPMDRTRILLPLNKEELSPVERKNLKQSAKNLRDHVENIPDDGSEVRTFSEFLSSCNVDLEAYIQLVRFSLDRPKMFLKREPRDVYINPYCVKILSLMRSNMDLQFIFDAFGCATYIIDYINKSDRGMSSIMQKIVQETRENNISVKEGMRKIVNSFYNNSELSIQEAAYNLLQLPLSEASEQEIYIPTGGPEERTRILKSVKELELLEPGSTNIFVDGLLEHYAQRPDTMSNVCLADFAAYYVFQTKGRQQPDQVNECVEDGVQPEPNRSTLIRLKDNSGFLRKRNKPKVIRFHRFSKEHEETKYWQSMVTLYLPWTDEANDILNIDPKAKAEGNMQVLTDNRKKYNHFDEETLETAMQNAYETEEYRETEQETDNNAAQHDLDEYSLNDPQCQADVFTDLGEYQTRPYEEGFMSPGRMQDQDYNNLVAKLNPQQRDYLMHISHHFSEEGPPVQHLITGGAGVGKSVLISALYQTFLRIFNATPEADPDKECVLLCAPTGMAAFNIKGRTLHSTFHFLKDMKDVTEISASVSNTMATKLDRVQVVIIDEISMVSGLQLQTVDKRLRDIFIEQLPFGGRSVIAVGDFMQLPCVAGAPVYSTDPTKTSNKYRCIFGQNLWSLFEVHHLTQIMRQSNVQFQTALNNLAKGNTTTEDNSLFAARTFPSVPEEVRARRPVHLFPTNAQVDSWNDEELDGMTGEDYTAKASDVAIGDGTSHAKTRATDNVKTLRSRDTMSLRNSLRLKVGARYMVTLNIDTPDGLVNGAVGTLMRVDHGVSSSGATKPLRLWVKFNHEFVGLNARQQKTSLMRALHIDPTWTPIMPTAKTIQRRGYLAVSRKQFPLTVAEAMTIHKSQGATYDCVVVHTHGRVTREMMYVACSRATSAEGLYIVGQMKKHSPVDPSSELAQELARQDQERMRPSFQFLREGMFNTQIMYHNIQSLPKHLKQVVNDEVFTKSDILLFGETWTLPEDAIDVPGFTVAARVDNEDGNRRAKGACILIRSDLQEAVTSSGAQLLRSGGARSISCAWAVLCDTLIMSVYAAPNSPPLLMQRLFDLAKNIPATWKLLIGDFNRNILIPSVRTKMDEYAQTAGLHVHDNNFTTTKARTQIDLVLSNFNVEAGAYHSLTSFHKPLWVGLSRRTE